MTWKEFKEQLWYRISYMVNEKDVINEKVFNTFLGDLDTQIIQARKEEREKIVQQAQYWLSLDQFEILKEQLWKEEFKQLTDKNK